MDGSLEAPTAEGSGKAWSAILHFEQKYSLSLGVRALLTARVGPLSGLKLAGPACPDVTLAATMAAPRAAELKE